MGSKKTFLAAALTVFAGYLSGVLTVFFRGGDLAAVRQFVRGTAELHWGQAFAAGPAFVVLTALCGVFLFGWLCVLPLIFYKSYGLGYTAGLFLAAFGTKGFLPVALCLFPSGITVSLLMIRVAKEALPLSFRLFRGISSDPKPFFDSLKGFLLRSLVFVQCSAIVLLWDLFLSPLILSGIRDLL